MNALVRRGCTVCGAAGCVNPEHQAWTEAMRGLSRLVPFLAAMVWLEKATTWVPQGDEQAVTVVLPTGLLRLRTVEPMVRKLSNAFLWWFYLAMHLERWGMWGESFLAYDSRAQFPVVPDDQPMARSIYLDDDLERISERRLLPSERRRRRR